MSRENDLDIHKILLDAHRKGIKEAIDRSIRTGVPLVVEVHGKIKQIKPKYKYVRVPITSTKKQARSSSKS